MARIKLAPAAESESAPPEPTASPVAAPAEVTASPANGVDRELKQKSGGRFSAFAAFPDGVSFTGEETGENVILLLRQHIITNVPWILVTTLLLLAPLVLFPAFFMAGIIPPVPAGFRLVALLFWYLATGTYVLLNFLYWYFNAYLLTNERVVDIDWFSIIYRRVSSAQVSKIQDISATQSGVVAGIFDFGDVVIQTAGELPNFDFENVPHPQLVAKKLNEMTEKEEKQWEANP